jgi:hypothetical protein
MQAKSWILMRILLNRFHPRTSKEFLGLLPPEDAKQILSQDVMVAEIDAVFVKPQEFLKNIHYSWVAPFVQKKPKHVQELILSALPNPLALGLKKFLKISSANLKMPPRAAAFFLRKLYEEVRQPEVLAPDLLPKGNLSILLDLPRQELIDLIDYLGLYDLAEEVRHIVDKKSLQTIYGCLGQKKLQFMRLCLHQKSKFAAQKMNLQKWNGDCEELLQTLHQRGLYRFGKALCGTHPHFLWHLSRRLDTGRSAMLEKYYTTQASPGVTSQLGQQIINVLNFLKQKSEM